MIMNTTINLTDSAAEHVKSVLARNDKGIGLRLGVKPTGCSGYQYIIDTATDISNDDETIETNGVKVIIDKESLAYFNGTTLDFSREGLNSGFKFQNPNVEDSCGCGESVSFKQTDNE